MPFINIRLVSEVIADDPEGKKVEIARKVTSAITQVTGLAEDDVWVVFEEVAARDWFVGSKSVHARRIPEQGETHPQADPRGPSDGTTTRSL